MHLYIFLIIICKLSSRLYVYKVKNVTILKVCHLKFLVMRLGEMPHG